MKPALNIYLIERTDEVDYDEYHAHVVQAEGEQQALRLCEYRDEVISQYNCKVACIGVALPNATVGKDIAEIILSSFNAS